jgi:subtilisin family serine protease
MKTKITLFLLALILPFFGKSQNNFFNPRAIAPTHPESVKGTVLVRFKDDVQVQFKKSARKGVVQINIPSINQKLLRFQVKSLTKVFHQNRSGFKAARTFVAPDGKRIAIPPLYNIYQLHFDKKTPVDSVVASLKKDPNVVYAEPNYLFYTDDILQHGQNTKNIQDNRPAVADQTQQQDNIPDDPLFKDGSQPYLTTVDAPKAWDVTTGDSTQIIGILDTGVDTEHPDLKDNIWTNHNEIPGNGIDDDHNGYVDDVHGWDFINQDNNPADDNSHGTHVAGIAAAKGNNGIGMTGVAWNARIMPIKVMQSTGVGSAADIAKGVEYAANNNATVINMSIGSYGESLTLKAALENAYAGTGDGKGSITVAAAGNDGLKLIQEGLPSGNMYPACYPFVIGVMAAENNNGKLAYFSNIDPTGPVHYKNQWGYNYEMRAPGVSLLSAKPGGSYWQKSGTSMASPVVAGALALLRSHTPSISGEQIFARLIQGSNNNMLDIYQSIHLKLVPKLYIQGHTMIDTLPGDNKNGLVNAGETVEIYPTIKNAGGTADSVWAKIRFGEFEDTTTAIIVDSTSYIGSIGTYSSLSGQASPFKLKIKPSVVNNRDIIFEIEAGCKNSGTTTKKSIILNVVNGEELTGVMDTVLTLTPNKLWLVTKSFRVGANGKLIIRPGASLKISGGNFIDIRGQVVAKGTKDSLINITSTHGTGAGFFRNTTPAVPDTFMYCAFTFMGNPLGKVGDILRSAFYVDHCLFQDIYNANQVNTSTLISGIKELKNSVLRNINGNTPLSTEGMTLMEGNDFYNLRKVYWAFESSLNGLTVKYNNFVYNSTTGNAGWAANPVYDAIFTLSEENPNFLNNNIIQNSAFLSAIGNNDLLHLPHQYWGKSDGGFANQLHDFWDDPSLPEIITAPVLSSPSPMAPGIVWKVLINGKDPNEEQIEPVGSETVRFDIYFNRPMDTMYTPLVGFGVREPFLQHIVSDSAHWSSDSTIWSAYYKIGPNTGDGINTICIENAKDPDGFEIPPERYRFKFNIQAASSESINFMATPGIGKVKLEWPAVKAPDVQGYNIYRFYNLTDSTFSDTTLINSQLVLDTVYSDFDVIPDTTYHYFYKTLRTSMEETDKSKTIAAKPLKAANGDANGDLSVNVLDITSMVSYILGENPQPFLFDAADVNYDKSVDILDIVETVRIINNTKTTAQGFSSTNTEQARYTISNNILTLESKGNISALQFTLSVNNKKLTGETAKTLLKQIHLESLQKGFEFTYGINGNHLTGLLFSLGRNRIPEGNVTLFRLTGFDTAQITVSSIFGSSPQGQRVSILKKDMSAPEIPTGNGLLALPNPFNSSTHINYLIPEEGSVTLQIFDLAGRKVKSFLNKNCKAGRYSISWDGANNRNQSLKPGMYIIRLNLHTSSGKQIRKELKIVLTH